MNETTFWALLVALAMYVMGILISWVCVFLVKVDIKTHADSLSVLLLQLAELSPEEKQAFTSQMVEVAKAATLTLDEAASGIKLSLEASEE